MPSKTPKQARLMAAVAHGWHPDKFKGPSVAVAKEFNQADKGSGILARHAKGGLAGMVKPPTRNFQPPVLGHMQSPIGMAIQNKGNAGRYAGGMGLAPARPPRVPIAGMLRNVDQGLGQKRIQLRALGGSLEEAQPTPQPDPMQATPEGIDPRVKQVITTALSHLQAMDASSAAAVLRSSPEAMSHPEVAAIEKALRTATGITPATKELNQLSQAAPASGGQPLQRLQPPSGIPAGGPPQAAGQPPPSSGMPAARAGMASGPFQ